MYTAKNFSSLLGTPGLSDALLHNHFTLYEGYVKNTNLLLEKLSSGETGTPEYTEFKRHFGWEFNGMRLHELYFGNLNKIGQTLEKDSLLEQKLIHQFGTMEAWEKDFRASGIMRGIGWVVLVYDKESDQLMNSWINEHDVGFLAGTIPLLVMDVFEHAYMGDYDIKRLDYIEAFFPIIDWKKVSQRFELCF